MEETHTELEAEEGKDVSYSSFISYDFDIYDFLHTLVILFKSTY